MFCVQLSKPRDNFIEQKMHLLHCMCAILFYYQSMYNIKCVNVHSRYAPKQFPQNYSLGTCRIILFSAESNGIQGGNLFPLRFPHGLYVCKSTFLDFIREVLSNTIDYDILIVAFGIERLYLRYSKTAALAFQPNNDILF